MLRIDIYKAAQRFVDRLPPKQQKQVMRKIPSIAGSPEQQDVRPLRGHPDLLRADIEEYRIIYAIEDDLLSVLMAGKRNDIEIYRQLRRK
jgi:mRNA interferase RelE/StbE